MSERDMARLIALLERTLGADWRDVVEWLRTQNSVGAIEARIIAGDYLGAVAEIQSAALRFAADTQQAYVTAGQKAAKWLDAKVDDALVQFDAVNDRAVRRARANQYELIRGFTDEQRTITRNVVVAGHQRGANPREIARDLRDSIGLTETQEQHVRNYRRALESGDYSRAMGYKLRDGRADRTMRTLNESGESLSPARIDALTERYRANYVNHRAETIARTEGLRAAHEGSADLMAQAIERGDVTADELETTWHSRARGKRARPDHQAMDEVSTPYGTPFTLPDGTRMAHPGDPAGGAEHNANCGCAASTTYRARDTGDGELNRS